MIVLYNILQLSVQDRWKHFVDQIMPIYNFLGENHYQLVAGVTGLEPATSCVTGRRSNQAELHPHI